MQRVEQAPVPDWRRWFWVGLAAMFILFGVAAVIQALYGNPSVAPSRGAPYFGWMWGLLGVLLLVWFVGLIFRPPWWYRRGSYQHRWAWGSDEAAEILKVRYAKGEITGDQFERMMQELQGYR